METVDVLVHGFDPVSQAGTAAILERAPRLRVRPGPDEGAEPPDVVVVVTEDVAGAEVLGYLKQLGGHSAAGPRSVVVARDFRSEDTLVAVEHGVAGFLRRSEITRGSLVAAVVAVGRGAAIVPAGLQGLLLAQLTRLRLQVLEPEGLTLSGLAVREQAVLRLIAEGYQTEEIAERLPYSEGTVKNVLYGLMTRLELRSRSHAVAYALRAGVI